MIIAQQPTQSLAPLNRQLATGLGITRKQHDVTLPLVIALSVIMLDVFS